MLGIILVVAALVVLAAVAVGLGLRALGDRASTRRDEAASADRTLRYVVPDHQDPTVVATALEEAGHHVAVDEREPHLLRVPCEVPEDRERVRDVISSVRSPSPDGGGGMPAGPVHFADED